MSQERKVKSYVGEIPLEPELTLVYLDDLNRKMDDLIRLTKQQILNQSPLLATTRFPTPYQFLSVNAGARNAVYTFDIKERYGDTKVGLITKIGNNWFANTQLIFSVDNTDLTVERQIAPVSDPLSVNIVFEDRVVWTAVNSDTVAHVFEALTDGYLVERELWDHLKEIRGELVSELRELKSLA